MNVLREHKYTGPVGRRVESEIRRPLRNRAAFPSAAGIDRIKGDQPDDHRSNPNRDQP